ncbi:SRPBCC family protein [Haloferax larsenii]|uniref:Polyketide cyclase / dehydrase and lipid transport n=1 Tax=Haloferax larsenii TaxID=302484 RepID=A0A1H7T2W6_HALLR|nr:SRPBCC family protein [Haloferax larsenii]SEL78594.1 Polyketide cyclase / dehydrase and lipid transport [Haloferax larsenii]
MHTVSSTRTIDTPVATVWNTIDDFGNVYRFHPDLEHSENINDAVTGEGAQRQCDFYDGGTIREEVVESVPEQRQVTNVFDLGSFPLKEMVGGFDLKPLDENSTEVTFTMSFVPKYGPVGWLMAKVMMNGQFRDIAEGILAGLDTHLQTGEVVGPDGNPEMEDAAPSARAA